MCPSDDVTGGDLRDDHSGSSILFKDNSAYDVHDLGLSNRRFDRCYKCTVTWATAASSYAEINIPTDQINHQIVLILL